MCTTVPALISQAVNDKIRDFRHTDITTTVKEKGDNFRHYDINRIYDRRLAEGQE